MTGEAFPPNAEEHEGLRPPSRVAILDAGGQYVDMVWKAIERQGVPADKLALRTPVEHLESHYGAVVISGSPASSHTESAPHPRPEIWNSDLPILGICYGMQSMALAHGGKVAKNGIREDGRATTGVATSHPFFNGAKQEFQALFTHGDFVTEMPAGFEVLGSHRLSDDFTAYSAIAKGNKIGVQFHPEVFDDTPGGYQLFKNFLFNVAELESDEDFQTLRLEKIITEKRQRIHEQVAGRDVVAFISGGVDSSVAAKLAAEVIPPEQFHGFYIDNGFMRDEDDSVIDTLRAAGIEVEKFDASELFESAKIGVHGPLVDIEDPEIKRKIIGKRFIDLMGSLLAKKGLLKELKNSEALLLQGTNAADRIESGHSTSDANTETIKTHHNQVPEAIDLKARGLLIEPLDDLFKDEVRELGHELGLPAELVERQPFPGPGTAIRILAMSERSAPQIDREAESSVRAYLKKQAYLRGKDVQAYLLPVRSVGVGGDGRTHKAAAGIGSRYLDGYDLAQLANDLPAHFENDFNRVIFALGQGDLQQPMITETKLNTECKAQLRLADSIVYEEMRAHSLLSDIKQFPVVLLPLSFGQPGERSIVLRPVTTSTFMTVQAMLPERDLPPGFIEQIADRIITEVPGISQVFLDITNKPPATTEWE